MGQFAVTPAQTELRSAAAEWIGTGYDTFIMVSLKQSLWDGARWTHLTREQMIRTARFLHDRLVKKLGRRLTRHGGMWPFVVFYHDHAGKRLHLHIMAECPSFLTPEQFERIFRDATKSLDWIHREIDFRPIKDGATSCGTVVEYCLRGGDGLDNMIFEASYPA